MHPFRALIPDSTYWRTAAARGRDAYGHAEQVLSVPFIQEFVAGWREKARSPFVGITTDGTPLSGLYTLADEGAPTAAAVAAARALLEAASDEQRRQLCYPVDAPQWRHWSNPEFYVNRHGLRFEEVSEPLREAMLALMRASLSEPGYAKVRGCMRTNAFLGELVALTAIMNEWSYNFSLFGAPSASEPWGWQCFGHHLAVNCLFLGRQMVLSPTFLGAEPNIIDTGPQAGTMLFRDEERIGLALMQSLSAALRERAQVYRAMRDAAMPEGRWHPADQRQMAGAFQDNRVIPYEGVRAAQFDAAQRRRLLDLIGAYVVYLPAGPLAARLAAIERHLDVTHFCWIGGYSGEDAFYYRIQSPVVLIEFDHHSGVWLTNTEPAKCHIHTIVRTPNGNDYGQDLLRAHYQAVHPGEHPARGRLA